MQKFSPYSFSKLSCHDGCPRKFKYSYIDKLPRKPQDMTALWKGSAIHSSLEKYPNPGTHKMSVQYQPIVDNFLKTKYKKYLVMPSKREEGIGLDEHLNPIPYSKKCLFRGYVDYYTVEDDMLIIEVDSLDDVSDDYEIIEIIEK